MRATRSFYHARPTGPVGSPVPFDLPVMAVYTGRGMAGPRKTKGASASRKRAARPVLGNDPFERGAAPRAPAPRRSAQARREDGAPERRLDEVEAKPEAAAEGGEARLEEVLRRSGSASYVNEARELVTRLLPALVEQLRPLASLAKLLARPGPLDAHGMDPRLAETAKPLLDFLYERWWRVAVRAADRIPAGGAVVVANHGGPLHWDALVLRLALGRADPPRQLRPLLDEAALSVPFLGPTARRLGAVPATPDNALALLGAGALVGVFPEGSRGGEKPWGERYRVQRFGRGGFAKIALLAGAPLVPCAIVGGEEATPPVSRAGWLAEFLGLPFLSLAPALPLGPLGGLPLPSRWSIRFGDPVETRSLGPDASRDPAAVAALTEKVREAVQEMLDEDVAARTSVFL